MTTNRTILLPDDLEEAVRVLRLELRLARRRRRLARAFAARRAFGAVPLAPIATPRRIGD